MESFIRIAVYLVVGAMLVLANIWYIRTLRRIFNPDEYVIAPIRVIGQEDKDGTLGIALAQMLQARLKSVVGNLAYAQKELSNPTERSGAAAKQAADVIALVAPIKSSLNIPVALLEPANINVSVGGVQVGGVIPWMQRLFTEERTLNFIIFSRGKDQVTVSGDAQPLARGTDGSILFESSSQDQAISDLAYAIVRKRMMADPSNRIAALQLADFRSLLQTLDAAAIINRKIVLGGVPNVEEARAIAHSVVPIADNLPGWPELNYFAAVLADRGGDTANAVKFYGRVQDAGTGKDTAREIAALIESGKIQERIKALSETEAGSSAAEDAGVHVKLESASPEADAARKKIASDIDYACDHYDTLLHTTLNRPKLVLVARDERNSFYLPDKNTIYVPALAEAIPDLTFRETAHAYISKAPFFTSVNTESLAIESSYADVFAAWLKQKRNGETAATASWLLYEGAVAWILGEDPRKTGDKRPLRSLKAPGTAYKNAGILGDDRELDRYVKTAAKGQDYHPLSGVPNRAFYETAKRLDTDRAVQIWAGALPSLKAETTLKSFAAATSSTAESMLGTAAGQSVRAAWLQVGIAP